MIHSSAILKSTAMDTTNVAATTTETVANVIAVKTIKAFTRPVTGSDGKKVEKIFVAINDLPATSIDNVVAGAATAIMSIAQSLYGVDGLNVVLASAIGKDAEVTIDDEYIESIDIKGVDIDAMKSNLMFFKTMM